MIMTMKFARSAINIIALHADSTRANRQLSPDVAVVLHFTPPVFARSLYAQ